MQLQFLQIAEEDAVDYDLSNILKMSLVSEFIKLKKAL